MSLYFVVMHVTNADVSLPPRSLVIEYRNITTLEQYEEFRKAATKVAVERHFARYNQTVPSEFADVEGTILNMTVLNQTLDPEVAATMENQFQNMFSDLQKKYAK